MSPTAVRPTFALLLTLATAAHAQPTESPAPSADGAETADAPAEPAAEPAAAEPAAAEPAAAEEPAAEEPQPPADPAALKAEATAAVKAGDCETAVARFDALVAALGDDPAQLEERMKARFISGVCLERLDRLEPAARAFRDVAYGGGEEALAAKAEARLTELEPFLPVAVTFVCEDEGVLVAIDELDDEPRACDEAWKLTPGIYRGVATAPDGRAAPVSVQVTAGVPEEVVVLMPASTGRKLVAPPPETAPEAPGPSRVLAWSLSAGAVAVVGGGIAFNVLARDAVDEGNEAYSRYERARAVYDREAAETARVEVEDARDRADTYALMSYALFGVGVGLAGAATWAWLDDGPAPEAATVQVVPAPGGVGLIGRW